MSAEENFKKYREIVDFIKTLNDEEIEMFIEVSKEQGVNIGDEDTLRETLEIIRDGK